MAVPKKEDLLRDSASDMVLADSVNKLYELKGSKDIYEQFLYADAAYAALISKLAWLANISAEKRVHVLLEVDKTIVALQEFREVFYRESKLWLKKQDKNLDDVLELMGKS
jgi:hypothetical protein